MIIPGLNVEVEELKLVKYEAVTETGCWIWTGSWNRCGYGQIRNKEGKYIGLAHRIMYACAKGAIPQGMHLCHKCDTPSCVNPDHMFIGDAFANFADCRRKGRTARGERNHKARLTTKDIENIYAMKGQFLQREIAAMFGVNQNTISRILSGHRWSHLSIETTDAMEAK